MHENFQRKLMSRFLFIYLFFFVEGRWRYPFQRGYRRLLVRERTENVGLPVLTTTYFASHDSSPGTLISRRLLR